MSVEMQIFYYTIDTIVSIFYCVCLILLLSNVVDHKKYVARTVWIYIGMNILVTLMTMTAVPILIKVIVHTIYVIIMYRLFLTEKTAAVAIHVVYFWFISAGVQEDIIIFFCKLNNIVPWVDVGHGVQLGKARVILISSFFMLVLTLLLKYILKPISEFMDKKVLWFLVISGFIFNVIEDAIQDMYYQYAEGFSLIEGIILIAGIAFIAVLLCVLAYKFLYMEKRGSEERIRREALEKQYVYYQEKQKEEEKVRSIYHDMKNHLLVLEYQIHSPETAEMVEKLQREMESYADYAHTGNDFLDVIVKDKAQIAREKQIDFSSAIDLHGIDFLEPLDISTIFGNGLDNAIEASEKLPEDRRVIQVKAGRVQDFLSILMENNCLEESDWMNDRAQRKGDDYFHGFGISNMKNAAEKYGGQLTVHSEDGKFTLKILIPLPRC